MTNTYNVGIYLRDYIANPFWPELNQVIEIRKRSGTDRCRSEQKREAALTGYLEKNGIPQADYDKLVNIASKKWYTTPQGLITIPRHHLAGCLVQTVKSAPKAIRGNWTDNSFRSEVRLSDFVTTKKDKDCLFERYVKNDATNQRRLTVDEVITEVTATGTVEFLDPDEANNFQGLLKYALRQVGVGSARKMGYGRGTLTLFTPKEQ